MDKNYWKDAYQDSWPVSSKKEEFIKNLLEKQTGFTVEVTGMGAGTATYISGSAEDNHFKKGDADLWVKESDAFVEVTGPNITMPSDATLWIRPDKIANSMQKIEEGKGRLHVVVHVQIIRGTNEKIVRGVIIDSEFIKRVKNKEFMTVNPRINQKTETYTEIKHNDPAVIDIEQVIEAIKKAAVN